MLTDTAIYLVDTAPTFLNIQEVMIIEISLKIVVRLQSKQHEYWLNPERHTFHGPNTVVPITPYQQCFCGFSCLWPVVVQKQMIFLLTIHNLTLHDQAYVIHVT